MKTAMQELIEFVNTRCLNGDFVLEKANELLEKEKEQIIDAHLDGMYKLANALNEFVAIKNTMLQIQKIKIGIEKHDNGEEYYNQTYNQKIPELLYKDGTPMRKVKLGKEAQELLDEIDNEKKGDLVRLLRWVLKHYSTGTDIEGFFMWENPIGEEFDSIQVVDHYLNQNK